MHHLVGEHSVDLFGNGVHRLDVLDHRVVGEALRRGGGGVDGVLGRLDLFHAPLLARRRGVVQVMLRLLGRLVEVEGDGRVAVAVLGQIVEDSHCGVVLCLLALVVGPRIVQRHGVLEQVLGVDVERAGEHFGVEVHAQVVQVDRLAVGAAQLLENVVLRTGAFHLVPCKRRFELVRRHTARRARVELIED